VTYIPKGLIYWN